MTVLACLSLILGGPCTQPRVQAISSEIAILDQLPTASVPARRIRAVGLFGMSFAPEGLDNCQEMDFYRIQAGLPSIFNGQRSNPVGLGWRESNCRNEVSVHTSCCWGYWQMNFGEHTRDATGSAIYDHCQVSQISDYNGDEPLDKQKQACTAYGLYRKYGLSPWGR